MTYVEHPRYGSEPRITGLDVDPDDADVHLHWFTNMVSSETHRHLVELGVDPDELGHPGEVIPGTAIEANLERQTPATCPVTHYYDMTRACRDCDRPFIFFAAEQQHWYEELQFPLESDCVRCHPCREAMRELQDLRFRYEALSQRDDLTAEEELELAVTRMTLIEAGVFSAKQIPAVRAFINRFPDHSRSAELRERIARLGPEEIPPRFVKGRRRSDG